MTIPSEISSAIAALALCAACGNSETPPPGSPPAAQGGAAAAQSIQIDTSDPAQFAQWPQARARLAACEPFSVDILYSFGVAQLQSAPEGQDCRLQIRTRGELGETDDWQQRYRCGTQVLELDWLPAQAGAAVRDRPPDEELASRAECSAG